MDFDLFTSLLEKHGLDLIGHFKTGELATSGLSKTRLRGRLATEGALGLGPRIDDYSNQQTMTIDVDAHLATFSRKAREAKRAGAVQINVHSGHDSWTIGEASRFFQGALAVEKDLEITITHETHRGRIFYSPYQARELFELPALENLKINADLSHWCVVCEHIFDAKVGGFKWVDARSIPARTSAAASLRNYCNQPLSMHPLTRVRDSRRVTGRGGQPSCVPSLTDAS